MSRSESITLVQGLAVYCTNTIDVKGAITTDGSTPYSAVPLTATLYGDFDFDAVDVARLAAAWCTCLGDANDDPLTGSDCTKGLPFWDALRISDTPR